VTAVQPRLPNPVTVSAHDTARKAPSGPDATRPARSQRTRVLVLFVALIVGLVVVSVISAALGQFPIRLSDVGASILHRVSGPLHWGHPVPDSFGESTLWQVRMPRVVMSLVVGAALACAGAVMQGVFGNPLADSGVVGVSSGAAVGAAAAIVTGTTVLGEFTIPAAAFVAGLLATVVVYLLSRSAGRTEVVTLVLTGIAVNAVTGAALAFCLFFGSQSARDEIVFWQLGSLNGSRWGYLVAVAPFAAVGIGGALMLAGRLDLLALGDRAAKHLGVHVELLRLTTIVLVAVMTAAAVSFAGVIGFVGLIVPHLIRMIVGPGHRILIPASALGGAVLLAAADLVARNAIPYADLPIGMLTALIGGPVFFWLLRRTRARAGGWA
jgi:iron complex transport system permease protein